MTTTMPEHVAKLAALGWEISQPWTDDGPPEDVVAGPQRTATASRGGRSYSLLLEDWDDGHVRASCEDSDEQACDGYEISTSMEELYGQSAAEWIKAHS